MPTPSDHIDMMRSTKATALATNVIDANIAIKSTVHPPSVVTRYSVLGTRDSLIVARYSNLLLQREIHRHRHDDRYRHAVEGRRRENPLFHRIQRGRVEERD